MPIVNRGSVFWFIAVRRNKQVCFVVGDPQERSPRPTTHRHSSMEMRAWRTRRNTHLQGGLVVLCSHVHTSLQRTRKAVLITLKHPDTSSIPGADADLSDEDGLSLRYSTRAFLLFL